MGAAAAVLFLLACGLFVLVGRPTGQRQAAAPRRGAASRTSPPPGQRPAPAQPPTARPAERPAAPPATASVATAPVAKPTDGEGVAPMTAAAAAQDREPAPAPKLRTPQLPGDHLDPADLVWRVGRLDGRPVRPAPPADAPPATVVIRAGETPVPTTIAAGQSLVVRLPPLPPRKAVFGMVLNTGVPRRFVYPWIGDRVGQFLQVLFNDHIVYHRWVSESSVRVRAWIRPDWIREQDNRLVIRNQAGRAWAIDAAWLRAFRPGSEPVWAALQDADWLSAGSAASVAVMAVPLLAIDEALTADARRRLQTLPAPPRRSLSERQQAWRAENWPQCMAALPEGAGNRVVFDSWRQRLGAVLARGAEPLVLINHCPDHLGWLCLAACFREYVDNYHLANADAEVLAANVALLRRVAPAAHISVQLRDSHRPIPGAAVGMIGGGGYLIAERLMTRRRALLADSTTRWRPGGEHATLYTLTGLYDTASQNFTSVALSHEVVDFFHNGGNTVLLVGGLQGCGLFPQDADHPAAAWQLVRLLTRFGRGNARRLPCNVLPYDADYGLLDTSWCAVFNGRQQVSILVFAENDRGRGVTIDCPVPWRTPTAELKIRALTLSRRRPPRAEAAVTRTVPVTDAQGSGMVSFRLSLPSLALLRLRPPGGGLRRAPIIARQQHLRVKPKTDNRLFSVRPERLPRGLWQESLLQGAGTTEILGPNASVHVGAATPAPLRREALAVPWNRQSLFVRLTSPATFPRQPQGVRLRLQWQRFVTARRLSLWLRPVSSLGRRRVTLIAGTPVRRGRISLETDRWQCVSAAAARLFPGEASRCSRLTLLADETLPEYRDNGTVTFEINAVHALDTRSPAGVAVAADARLAPLAEADDDALRWCLLAPAGKAVCLFRGITDDDAFPTRLSDASSASTCTPFPAAGCLRLTVPVMPETSAADKRPLLRRLSPRLQARAAASEMAILPINAPDRIL